MQNEEPPQEPPAPSNSDPCETPEESVRNLVPEKERITQAANAIWNVIDYHCTENYLTNETFVGILEGIKYTLLKRWHGDDRDLEDDWKE